MMDEQDYERLDEIEVVRLMGIHRPDNAAIAGMAGLSRETLSRSLNNAEWPVSLAAVHAAAALYDDPAAFDYVLSTLGFGSYRLPAHEQAPGDELAQLARTMPTLGLATAAVEQAIDPDSPGGKRIMAMERAVIAEYMRRHIAKCATFLATLED